MNRNANGQRQRARLSSFPLVETLNLISAVDVRLQPRAWSWRLEREPVTGVKKNAKIYRKVKCENFFTLSSFPHFYDIFYKQGAAEVLFYKIYRKNGGKSSKKEVRYTL